MTTEPLTPQEQADLVGAIFHLAEAGDHEAAARVGELAKDPAELRRVMASFKPAD
jgi:hypothetical protein